MPKHWTFGVLGHHATSPWLADLLLIEDELGERVALAIDEHDCWAGFPWPIYEAFDPLLGGR